MKNILPILTACILAISCNDSSRPDGTGYTTINYSEPMETQCPYCYGTGVATTYYGPQFCSNCNGTGKSVNISFKSRTVKTLKKNKKCPNGNTTFECIDEHNNGIISTTDRCIHCEHLYYVHD